MLNTQGHGLDQIEAARPADPVYGWVHEIELLRLEEALATAGDKPVLIFCHQLLLPWTGNYEPWFPDFYAIRNGEAVLALMARYGNVQAVFQAHAHRFDVQRAMIGRTPCHFVILPAIIEYPMGWLNLELTPAQPAPPARAVARPELAEISLHSGEGQGWRRGESGWAELVIDL